jgi:hypothetical protein
MGHTPGPWTANAWGDGDYEINAADTTVCNVPGFDDDTVDTPRAEDNARLIAAAPELLAVCQAMAGDLQALLDGDDFSGMSDAEMFGVMLRSLNAARAKAEGRSE